MAYPLPPDPYMALGVPKDASLAVIRSAHRKLVLTCHPDRIKDEERAEAAQKFRKVQAAYEILRDESSRSRYDETVKLAELRAEMREISRPDQTAQGSGVLNLEAEYERPTLRRPSKTGNIKNPEANVRVEPPRRFPRGKRAPNENQTLTDLSRAARKALANQSSTAHRDTIEGLEGFLNEHPVRALADTGADQNFIAQAFAEQLQCGLVHYPRDARPSFLLGHGRQVHASAYVKIRWRFRKEPGKTYDMSFYVLPDCIFDVMIGGAFLYATSTMTLHRTRLSRIPRPRRALHIRVVNLCGTPSRRLNGVLHTEKCRALPDSGAEPNLLSYEYVKQRGWLVDMVPGPESCTLLQFADGSTETTEGRLHLKWSFDGKWDVTTPSASFSITFDVLRGCPFDVILGQDFLDQTNAFTKYVESFQDVYHEGLPGLNLVFWADCFSSKSRKKNTTTNDSQRIPPSQQSSEAAMFDELERRAEADRCIARIRDDPQRKSIETQKERRLRSQWDAAHPGILQQSSTHIRTFARPRSSSVTSESSESSENASITSSASASSQTTPFSQTSSNDRSSKTSISSDASDRSSSNYFTDSSTSQRQRRGPDPLDERHPVQPLRDAFLRRTGKMPLRPLTTLPDAS